MADNIVIISNLSPIKFVDESFANPVPYNTKYLDDFRYQDTQFDFIDVINYAHPIEQSDIYPLQLLANFNGPFILQMYNCRDELVHSQAFNYVASSIEASGLKVFQSNIAFAAFDATRYYFKLQIGNPVIKTLISESYELASKHPRSVLLQYKHNRNNYDMVFETGIQMGFRIPGGLVEYDPNFSGVVYIDQTDDMVQLSSDAFDLMTLLVGDQKGVPDFVPRLVRNIFRCSEVLIDGKQWVYNSGGQRFEAKRTPASSLTGWACTVREAQARTSKRFVAPADESPDTTTVVYNISSRGFGAISNPASDNIIQIESID